MKLASLTITVIVALAPGLYAESSKCATCADRGEARCFCCDGKGTIETSCALCVGRLSDACLNCGGKGTLTCEKCAAEDQPGQGGSSRNCVVCKGKKTLPCRVCVRGKVPCVACKGKQKVSRGCPVCSGLKKLPCPDCDATPKQDACPACKGEKKEPCPICQGSKTVPLPCATCLGSGHSTCGPCVGLGLAMCRSCNHLGRVESAICPKCRGKAYIPCANCKGKGTTDCAACSGKGGEGPCWACQAQGTLPCRRCAEPSKAWSGKDEASGVRVTVFPFDAFEPHLIAGMRQSFPTFQPVLWRIVIDTRESKDPFALGTGGAWQLIGTEPSDNVVVVGGSKLPQDVQARYAGLLAICGFGKEGGSYPLNVPPSRVVTTVLWEAGDPDAVMKGFLLRKGAGEAELTLDEETATWDDWIRAMSAAAKSRK